MGNKPFKDMPEAPTPPKLQNTPIARRKSWTHTDLTYSTPYAGWYRNESFQWIQN